MKFNEPFYSNLHLNPEFIMFPLLYFHTKRGGCSNQKIHRFRRQDMLGGNRKSLLILAELMKNVLGSQMDVLKPLHPLYFRAGNLVLVVKLHFARGSVILTRVCLEPE
jgi:hypothetical protein